METGMPVDKFSVSMPDALVAEVDKIASSEGLNRSAVIREATEAYITAHKAATAEQRRGERIGQAIEGFKGIAESWGDDSTSGLQYLDSVRGEGGPGQAAEPKREDRSE
jgi:predicted transcriptional regulator